MVVDQRVTTPPQSRRRAVLGPLTAHAVRAFLRNPLAAFFTLGFPLAFLIIVASIVGDQRTEAGLPIAQLLVAPFAVFGVAQGSFTLLAVDMAGMRESGVLGRLRAAPVPPWTVLGARIGAALVASASAVVLLVAVGSIAYDVEIVWRKVPAMLLTLVLGVACCAALGVALAARTRSARSAQTLAQGVLIPLAFISDVFIVGAELPRWLSMIGSALPLKHFAQAMAETFDPAGGYGFAPGHLAVLAAWGVVGALVAARWFGWQPRGTPSTRTVVEQAAPRTMRLSAPNRTAAAAPRMLAGQIGYALLGLRRDRLSVFFAVIFPALLLVLFPTVFGDGQVHGLAMSQYLFAGMVTYTVALAGYVDLPEGVVGARSAGVLKRLRGTPVPFGAYLAGRIGAALISAGIAAAVLAAVGVGLLGVRVPPAHVPALILAIGAGTLCFAALGFALVALLPSARSLVAVTLGTLLPLCFLSEIFVVGDRPLPATLTTIADVFPLRHLMQLMLAATRPDGVGSGVAWAHLAVLAGWTVAALLIARRRRDALA
jgi:ABC-type multidrug transport system permease subunit